MKFSTILTFAIVTTTLASAQSFQQKNADEAEKLAKDFAKLTPNSPCTDNQQACVQDKFAQCVGGKFALTSCANGLKCVVLPLVNKEGTSITCSTEQDRQKRLEDARNAGKTPSKTPAKSILPDDGDPKRGKENDNKNPKENDGKIPSENPEENDGKMPKENPKENDGKMPKENPKENDGKMPKENPKENDGKMPKENDPKKPKDNDPKKPKDNDPKKPKDNDPKEPKGNPDDVPPEKPKGKTPPAKKPDDGLAEIRRQNADDAEALQESFKNLTPDSNCEQNQIACVKEQIAQCDNGKFALKDCADGLICTALPLVLKRGTTVTCTTAEDRDNRLNEARNNLKK